MYPGAAMSWYAYLSWKCLKLNIFNLCNLHACHRNLIVWPCVLFCSSSGLTMSGSSNISQSLPAGEIQLNDVALNHYGTVLYSASGDRVRVWDLRKWVIPGAQKVFILCFGHKYVTCFAMCASIRNVLKKYIHTLMRIFMGIFTMEPKHNVP
jgi:hypothetical protein